MWMMRWICFTFNTADFIKVNQGGLVTFEIFVMKGSDLFFTTRRVETTTRRVEFSNRRLVAPVQRGNVDGFPMAVK